MSFIRTVLGDIAVDSHALDGLDKLKLRNAKFVLNVCRIGDVMVVVTCIIRR